VKRHLLVLLAVVSANAYGQSSNQPPVLISGKAELLNALKSPTLKVGDLFYLRTSGPWQQGNCTIPSHTTITGRIESLTVSPSRSPDTALALRFSEIPCSESKSTLVTPLLISIKAPDPVRNDRYDAANPQTVLLSGIFQSENRQSLVPTSGSAGAGRAFNIGELNQLHDVPVTEKPMKTGEVRGYRGIALTLPGREGPDARLSSQHKIILDRHTEFAFAYSPAPPQASELDVRTANPPPGPVNTPSANPVPAIPADTPSPPQVEMEDVCASSGCKELAAVAETSSARALWTLPLVGLGYQPRPLESVVGPDHSASVHFLGEDQILLTFTRHVLLPRSSDNDAWASNPRSVRGVLISRADGHVLSVKNWIVSDDIGPFVWGMGNGVVIAHLGHDLVRFGPGLTIQRRLRLAGPLLFLSASPNRNLLLVATVHEKHTEKEHAKIAAAVGPDVQIDEEYDLTGVNAAFQVIGTKRVTVAPLHPALLEASMVSARPMRGKEWLLEESTWEGQSKRFAHFRSICPLQIQSFPGDLLFVQGCSPIEAFTTWYRVLNAQGATLFKGSGPYSDLVQQTESSDDGQLFAIASSHFNREVDRTTTLQIGDFANLTVTVYDTTTGKQFFVAHLHQGSAQQDTFSLSPSGLAVLTSSSLQFFPVPALPVKK
jgi:hypothetical protein